MVEVLATIGCCARPHDEPPGPPPWAGEGPVSAEAYGAYLSHQQDVEWAEEWGMLDALGRDVPMLGDRLADWIDPPETSHA